MEWCNFPETSSKNNGSQNDKKNSEKNKNLKNNLQNVNEPEIAIKKNKHKNMHSQNALESYDVCASEKEQISEKDVKKSMEISNSSNKTESSVNKKKKNKKKQDLNNKLNVEQNQARDQQHTKELKYVQSKKQKIKNGDKAVRRKEITEKSFKLIINGNDVDLVRFDGFPIMKKDAERLQELKNSMLKKGIPKSEVARTIKLERRRAEKALARLKRDVCYNCRKGGHNLSDCPDLKSNIPGVETADGVCFKCGSTEHRQNECKVQRGKEFRFATCFICRETVSTLKCMFVTELSIFFSTILFYVCFYL